MENPKVWIMSSFTLANVTFFVMFPNKTHAASVSNFSPSSMFDLLIKAQTARDSGSKILIVMLYILVVRWDANT